MQWIHAVVTEGDLYLLLLLSLMIVNLLPPVPAEVVIPFSVTLFADHEFSLPVAIVAGTAGLVLGTLPLFYLGRWLGEQRLKQMLQTHRRWLAVTPEDIERSGRWFRRYGVVLVLGGRVIPGMRSLVSVPAGFHNMPLPAFLFWTTLGSAVWASLLMLAGHWLAHTLPGSTATFILAAFLVLFAAFYLCRVTGLFHSED